MGLDYTTVLPYVLLIIIGLGDSVNRLFFDCSRISLVVPIHLNS
jgi:hypothetical protein